jgi:hypothetical protein
MARLNSIYVTGEILEKGLVLAGSHDFDITRLLDLEKSHHLQLHNPFITASDKKRVLYFSQRHAANKTTPNPTPAARTIGITHHSAGR